MSENRLGVQRLDFHGCLLSGLGLRLYGEGSVGEDLLLFVFLHQALPEVKEVLDVLLVTGCGLVCVFLVLLVL